jgi:4-hydroxybenzoate polyprenyltransferase
VGIVTVLNVKIHGFTLQSMLAIASFLFLSIALFSFDDAHDSVSDKLIHPKRPIPEGVFTVNQVYLLGTVFFFLGTASSFSLLLYQFALFLIVAVLGLSVIFLKLNSIVRAILTASMIFLLFPFSMSITSKSLLFGLIVAIPHVAGSIAKDFIHREGDERIGLQPPARWARYVASGLFFICGGVMLLPIALDLVSWLYVPLIVPTFVSCLILGYKVLNQQYPKVYIYGGIAMLSALVAFSINI